MKRPKQPRKGWFIARWTIVIGVVMVTMITVNILALGNFRTVLDGFFRPSVERSAAVTEASSKLTEEIEAEGMVLLKNEDNVLPLAKDKRRVNVFGWSSTNPVYGGTGSGAVDATSATNFLAGLESAGIEYNTKITDFYQEFRDARPAIEIRAQDWTVPEPSMKEYDDAGIFESAQKFSDTAVVMISRSGGEGADLATSLAGQTGDIETQTLPDGREVSVGVAGSEYADDVDAKKHYLELSNRERAMLERVTEDFENVIVLLNVGNTLELDWINELAVDSVAWIGGPGESGFNAVGRMLTGDVNPSGRTVDTWLYDLLDHPSMSNFGAHSYLDSEKVDTGDVPISYSGDPATRPGFQFVGYAEGIYVGYRYFETFYQDDEAGYDDVVQFPFGYGLSYTMFTQDLGELVVDGENVQVDVTVTNTGDVAGKDAVQLYSTPPYTEGGIEKSAVNLVAFDKTKMLEPGASETVKLTIPVEELASFDKDTAGSYVLDSGTYRFSLRGNAHDEIASRNYVVDKTVVFGEDNARSTDKTAALNLFEGSEGELTTLSRAGNFANAKVALEPVEDREMTDAEKSAVVVKLPSNSDAKMPKTGADNGVTLEDMIGVPYDDPSWEPLLDQLTVDEMIETISLGGYQTKAIDSIGKPATIDIDGPQGLSSFLGASVSAGAYPTAMVIASTWNADLAYERGQMVGYEALELGVNGWYAPGMNLHRSPFGGRNFEYYSEDSKLSATMAAGETRGAQEQGLYVFIKHFVVNDQETYRNSRILTWVDEQTLREIYMKPFEAAVKDGGATAIMSAYNYVNGSWAGGNSQLLNTVLRQEWGFNGMVLSDYFGDYGYMNADWAVANGGDVMLSTLGAFGATPTRTDAKGVSDMRTSVKNVLYTVANSNAMYSDAERMKRLVKVGGHITEMSGFTKVAKDMGLEPWVLVTYIANVLIGLLLLLLIIIKVRKYRRLFPREAAS